MLLEVSKQRRVTLCFLVAFLGLKSTPHLIGCSPVSKGWSCMIHARHVTMEPCASLHNITTTLAILLCIRCTSRHVLHYGLPSRGQTITAGQYSQKLKHVLQSLKETVSALVNRKCVLFLRDNAKPRLTRVAMYTIRQLGW